MESHIDEFNKLALDLEIVYVTVDDEDKAIMFLSSLPSSYEHFVDTLMSRRDTLSMEDVTSTLKSKELSKRSVDGKDDTIDVLFVRGRKENFKRDCPERKKNKYDSPYAKGQSNQSQDESLDGYESSEVLVIDKNSKPDGWILDSGCSFHMTHFKSYFKNLEFKEVGTVKLGDGRPCKILGTFESECFNVSLKNGRVKVIKGFLVVLSGIRGSNNIYCLDGELARSEANAVVISKGPNQAVLWHQRLGHLSHQESKKQDVLGEFPETGVGFREYCILGKAHREKFARSKYKSTGVLDYVHSDVLGPSRILSIGGANYFISMVDDYSRRVWVFLLKHKSDALEKFKEWVALVENQTERKIKKLRTDNGFEFCGNMFNKFCKSKGIARHLTVPGTPQQNGIVDWMNRTLLNKVRCIPLSLSLPK
ncbi:hypothetical protein SSX86_007389 [Deinandra increscens subsp. villosa]|uniref:Integrase catalytic domain-containing protein n=1 Tax=Deinandra increscens subsp. villosa TaxID=3103831 RepID=A0AAP0DI40_9ASTR